MRDNYRRRGFKPRTQPGPMFPGPVQAHRPPPFDAYCTKEIVDDIVCSEGAQDILERAAALSPTEMEESSVLDFTNSVVAALNIEKDEKTLPNVKIEQVAFVGSFATDTALNGTLTSDVIVQLSTLPSYETITTLGDKIVANLGAQSVYCNVIPRDYGCCIMSQVAQVRVLITIVPQISAKLEPDLHLNEKLMMVNFFAIRHLAWFKGLEENLPADLVKEFRALVRVLKDFRKRSEHLQSLSIWALQYIAYYCLTNGPGRKKIDLKQAFCRFFQVLAAGLLMPKSVPMIDPTSTSHKIGWDLSFSEMEEICMTAQSVTKILASGEVGFKAVLGVHAMSHGMDITKHKTEWNGIAVHPGNEVYVEGCMEMKNQ